MRGRGVERGVDVKVHREPAWRGRADFIIEARVEHGGGREIREQLWARAAGGRFEVCCIPFFVPDLALGDEVEVEEDEAGRHLLRRVVKASGNETYWVWFEDDAEVSLLHRVRDGLERLGCLTEGYSRGLLAFNAESAGQAERALEFLGGEEFRPYLECVSSRTGA